MTFDKKNVKATLFIVFVSILFFWGLQRIEAISDFVKMIINVLMPFIAGGAIAFVVNVPMRRIEKLFPKKMGRIKRPIAYILTLVCLCAVLAFALFVIIPDISRTIANLALQVPGAIETVKRFFEDVMGNNPQIENVIKNINIDFDALGRQAISILQNSATGILNISVNIISNVVSGILSFVIAFMFSIYILMQKEKLSRQAKKVIYSYLPVSVSDKFIKVMKMSNKVFSNFISGQCIEALILGFIFFVILSILKFPYALLICVVISISALVPVVGAFIGCIVGALLLLMVNPLEALIFIIIFIVVQQIEGNLIYPHVVGSSVGLPSIWVLVAVTLGAGLYGVMGILIFIPLCSVIYALFKESVSDRLKERKIPKEKYE
ncbi:MAG: AI-2E family transporter [Ruminococcaceae bacterium]|nr:AI-2E family transporter [Oscillospiraceae bacterium]